MNLEELKKDCLVFDLETSAVYSDGKEVNIQTSFNDYVDLAQVKWFGAYSYKDNKEYYLYVPENRNKIYELLNNHEILVGFNSADFDYPILKNNNLLDADKWYTQTDCMKILGSSTFKDKNGFKYKGRGELMNYKFKKNSLECMAETMGLKFKKSEIDYKIFQKEIYTDKEKREIIKYLRNDVMATKYMFDELWEYWKPFTKMLDYKSIKNLSWIRSSIASLVYKSICNELGVEPTYSDKKNREKEEGGGNVYLPKYEEANGVWYLDVSSLYPNIFCMFNLFNETSKDNTIAWHGNETFKVRGYYDISYQPKLSKIVETKLKERFSIKDKDSPLLYTLKIFLNTIYGIVRSPIFEKVHTPNAGYDVCYLGRQIQNIMKTMFEEFGFELLAGDTDAVKIRALNNKHNNREYVQSCIDKIIKRILDNAPFPVDTFNIKIENYLEYILFPFSEEPIVDEETRKKLKDNIVEGYIHALDEKNKKIIIRESDGKIVKKGNKWTRERTGRKKNYFYLYEKDGKLKYEIVGLPIKKDGATPLGLKIFKEALEPKILEKKRAKFSKEFIDDTLNEYLKSEEIMKLLAREFKVKPFNTYKIPKGQKEPTGIHAQISKAYFNGGDGVISLIKNNKIGKAGKTQKYCTIKDAVTNNLTIEDLDLEKVYNELDPFIFNEFWVKNHETNKEYLVNDDAYDACKETLERVDR